MLSSYQLYRAKKKALELIHGAIDDQYAHLRNYAEELLRSNPGSSVKPISDQSNCSITSSTTCTQEERVS